ncbi:MAG: adenylate kinase [Lentimonas sp.]
MRNVNGKSFVPLLSKAELKDKIEELVEEMTDAFSFKNPLFLVVLDGAFVFGAELFKQVDFECEIAFVKLKSYEGTVSTGAIEELSIWPETIKGRDVIVLEDIVDTGNTMAHVLNMLEKKGANSAEFCTLLFKPSAFKGKVKPRYIGFSIPNEFVIGFGLDYDGLGRNSEEIYQLKEGQNPTDNMLNIVLFGPPGAGKGTQSEILIQKYGLKHLSTGDIFRYNMSNDTELGRLAKSYINKGQLVPDEVTINMLKDEVTKTIGTKGFIFDGFPRTHTQALALDEFLLSMDSSISVMLALEVEEEELKQRLLKRAEVSGRVDDADSKIIANRIEVYKKETEPVKEFYKSQGKFSGIDGIGTIDQITQRLHSAIEAL